MAVAGAAALVAAGSAFAGAYGSKISVKAPNSVAFGSTYAVKVSGKTAASKANTVVAFEGGSKSGKTPLYCYPTFGSELKVYPKNEVKKQYAVHGDFSVKYQFIATHEGIKGLCAYLINNNGTVHLDTFAHATGTWTVS